MRFVLTFTAILVFAVFIACQSVAPPVSVTPIAERADLVRNSTGEIAPEPSGHDDDVKRITLEEAKAAFDNDEALFIDARSKSAYENEHIKGAINMTGADIEKQYKDIPTDRLIIVYCS